MHSALAALACLLLVSARTATAFTMLSAARAAAVRAQLPAFRVTGALHTLHRARNARLAPCARLFSAAAPQGYDHARVERKWQEYWDRHDTFASQRRPGRPKKYVLDMFPYPSGAGLHVGHPEGYTATDIMCRYWRMKGYDVLHPMGWDAFGLPAEQHAINTGTHPATTTYKNIATFKRQLKMLGFSYDWSRELATTDLEYVKWTQWIFLQLFKAGLATQSEELVNWCPKLGTVLANEEIIDGKSERGGHPVTRIPLRQWVLKITKYADKLEDGLDSLDWPEGTRAAQRAWIGKSHGTKIHFQIEGRSEHITVSTTRAETLMEVTYVVLAPEHPMARELATPERKAEVEAFLDEASGKLEKDRKVADSKAGVNTGSFAVHPLTGERVPIWIADYVLSGYGTGAVMAVPAHDERDFAFAARHGLPAKRVITAEGATEELPFTGEGVAVDSGRFSGMSSQECRKAITDELTSAGKGCAEVAYKLRDWIFSRQRYWGEPIPVYFPVKIAEGGDPRRGDEHVIDYSSPIPVDESELPVTLPDMERFEPGDDPQGCLARATEWRYFQKDGRWYARETNTMPQWAGSCWYYLRFTDPRNKDAPWSQQAAKDWLPVDLYVGGVEHAVLHLLYARFWHKVLYDLGHVDHPEPFLKLVHQGMILGTDGEKMSKSRGNVINPDDVVAEHGADALRMYEMFMGPLDAVKPWQTAQVLGVVRFRDRVFNLVTGKPLGGKMEDETLRAMHKTIKKVTHDIEQMSFNTAISAMMIFANHLASLNEVPRQAAETLVLLISPFAPHLAEECWELLGHKASISHAPWPTYEESLTEDQTVTIGVQINGKSKGTVTLAVDATQDDAVAAAQRDEKLAKMLHGKEVKRVIFVPGRILNLIVK